jgi:hypothetical protein
MGPAYFSRRNQAGSRMKWIAQTLERSEKKGSDPLFSERSYGRVAAAIRGE